MSILKNNIQENGINNKHMNTIDDYKSVYYTFLEILATTKIDGVSFSPKLLTFCEYSLIQPAFSTEGSMNSIYVIEINYALTDEIIDSWINYSSKCKLLYILVREDILMSVERILSTKISNYKVLSFRFEEKNGNINVIIE